MGRKRAGLASLWPTLIAANFATFIIALAATGWKVLDIAVTKTQIAAIVLLRLTLVTMRYPAAAL